MNKNSLKKFSSTIWEEDIMEKDKKISVIVSAIITVLGLVASIVTIAKRNAVEEPGDNLNLLFALSLVVFIIGVVALITALTSKNDKKKTDIKVLTQAALCAALCYIGFAYFKIDIPVGTEKTAIHFGNAFCVLAALLIGGLWGGMAGAVGMTLADLTSGYVTSAPKTFLLKLCIGLIVGLVAHKIFNVSEEKNKGKVVGVTIGACIAGMLFNVIADPLVGYFYKSYILGVPQDIAAVWAKIGAMATLVNAATSIAIASVLYIAFRPAMRKAGLLVMQSDNKKLAA